MIGGYSLGLNNVGEWWRSTPWPEQDQEEDSERDSDDEGNDIESESEEEDKLDLRQLKNMNAFELITKATKSTILSEKMKKQTTASKEEEESERIRRKLKERLQGKASVAQEGKESEQDGLRLKLLQRMRQEEERLELIYLWNSLVAPTCSPFLISRKQQEPPLMKKKKKIPAKKPAEPKPSTTQAANEEG